jgi:AraC-like DNA-binding protein
MVNNFKIHKPKDKFLSSFVEMLFFIDIPVENLASFQEDIIPYPRVTFGYFFDQPYSFTNHKSKEKITEDIIISKVSLKNVTVKPKGNRVKIVGGHLKPYALTFFTNSSIKELPQTNTFYDFFNEKSSVIQKKLSNCKSESEMFDELEIFLLKNLQCKSIDLIVNAVNDIELLNGKIKVSEIADNLNVSTRTLRNRFYKNIGCSPKEYIELVKLKKSIFELKFNQENLTSIAHINNYFDQSHFSKTIKQKTDKTPSQLKKEKTDFRFLQSQ